MNPIDLSRKARISILKMISKAKASHIASAFSIVDILSVLYLRVLKYDINDFNSPKRDRFVLSKGHAGSAVYAILCEIGFINTETLNTYYQNGSLLSGHISHKGINGVEISTGSLGQGAGMALGMAIVGKLEPNYNVYCIIGDGECNEGTIWELALFASTNNIDNFTLIIDNNKQQGMGESKNIINLTNIKNIFDQIGWNSVEIDGHNFDQIEYELIHNRDNRPKCIIANTIKGKGISFMENNILWHYKDPQNEDFDKAIKELEVID
jgi:transketolase